MRTCAMCDNELEYVAPGGLPKRRYCSASCRALAFHAELPRGDVAREDPYERTCLNCGEITPDVMYTEARARIERSKPCQRCYRCGGAMFLAPADVRLRSSSLAITGNEVKLLGRPARAAT